jgi:hypothetical protein
MALKICTGCLKMRNWAFAIVLAFVTLAAGRARAGSDTAPSQQQPAPKDGAKTPMLHRTLNSIDPRTGQMKVLFLPLDDTY